jgi:hypothetical protein
MNLLGRAVPTSIIQLFFPRVELHLFYNAAVFIPMAIGMYFHIFRPYKGVSSEEARSITCTCGHTKPARRVRATPQQAQDTAA